MSHPLTVNRKNSELNIWVPSDNHHGNTAIDFGIGYAANQIDSEPWDIGLNLGDVVVADTEGLTTFQGYITELTSNLSTHNLNQIYHVIGNHDRSKESSTEGTDANFKDTCSPFTTDNSNFVGQPYAPVGDYLCWHITIGNLMIITLGDYNAGPPPGGEDGLGSGNAGQRSAGNITTDMWTRFKSYVENNTDKIIIVASHITLKDTTIGSGFKEFYKALNRSATFDPTSIGLDQDSADRSGYIAYINNTEGDVDTTTGDSTATNEIKTWMETNGQHIDLWIHGHYHRKIGSVWAGRSHHEEKYGTHFINCSTCQERLHFFYLEQLEVKSGFLRIKGDTLTYRTYVHHDPNSVIPQGYYEPEEIKIKLKRNFSR